MHLDLFFRKLTTALSLGQLRCNATRVHGGLLHTMYRLDAATGTYAVKLLNPNVMKRPQAMRNFLQADKLEDVLQANHVPLIPSLAFDNKKLQTLNGQFFYVYEWYDGNTIKGNDVTSMHCRKISAALFHIHSIDRRVQVCERSPVCIDWEHYIQLARAQNAPLCSLLSANKTLLYESQNQGNAAMSKIPPIVAICHNDMDCKNVLWKDACFKIIDLECLGDANPYLELFELALSWSGFEECAIDFERFSAFIAEYFKGGCQPDIDWKAIYDSNYGRLAWLEYNVKRALLLECDSAQEQVLGMQQVKQTLAQAVYYKKAQDEILRCLSSLFAKRATR